MENHRQLLVAICPVCELEFDPFSYKGKKTYCSRECSNEAERRRNRDYYKKRKQNEN